MFSEILEPAEQAKTITEPIQTFLSLIIPNDQPRVEKTVAVRLYSIRLLRFILAKMSPKNHDFITRKYPRCIATISAGFEKGDFLVREEKGQRVYFDFFEVS